MLMKCYGMIKWVYIYIVVGFNFPRIYEIPFCALVYMAFRVVQSLVRLRKVVARHGTAGRDASHFGLELRTSNLDDKFES